MKYLFSLVLATTLLTVAGSSALAHEDREHAGYQLTVGFMNEPAFEGEMNAVSVRVTKQKEPEGDHDHGSSTSTDTHGHSHTSHDAIESEVPISVQIPTEIDVGGGVNVHIMTEGWRWAPDDVDKPHQPGAGHAHIYVDDVKISRVYGPEYNLTGLESGERHIRVTLNSNDHHDLLVDGHVVEAMAVVTVPGSDEQHDHAVEIVPVEGLQETLLVEVTHVPSGVSKIMDLRAVYNDPGHYAADLIPTSPGHYRLRLFGTIEDEEVDLTFDSKSGGGDFDDVQSSSVVHFPQPVPAGRELESAVRGAQEAAITAGDRVDGASTLGVVGIVLGAIGIALGGTAVVISARNRSS